MGTCFKQRKTYLPDHFLSVSSGIISYIITVLLIFMYSIKIGFLVENIDWDAELFLRLKITGIVIFAIEFIINLSTGYIDKGKVILDKIEIYNNYKKGRMIFDLLVFVALAHDLISYKDIILQTILNLMILFKMPALLHIHKNLEGRFLRHNDQSPYYMLYKLFDKILIHQI